MDDARGWCRRVERSCDRLEGTADCTRSTVGARVSHPTRYRPCRDRWPPHPHSPRAHRLARARLALALGTGTHSVSSRCGRWREEERRRPPPPSDVRDTARWTTGARGRGGTMVTNGRACGGGDTHAHAPTHPTTRREVVPIAPTSHWTAHATRGGVSHVVGESATSRVDRTPRRAAGGAAAHGPGFFGRCRCIHEALARHSTRRLHRFSRACPHALLLSLLPMAILIIHEF